MQKVQTPLPIGTIIRGRYLVERMLGTNGFDAVYVVSDRFAKHTTSSLFALQEVTTVNKQERHQFASKGKSLRQLHHHALPRVHHVFSDSKHERIYIFMDYIEGMNLEALRLRQREKIFSLSQAMVVMAPIMDAITYLHDQEPPVIHQNIKPTNIILSKASGNTVLIHFGLFKKDNLDSPTVAIRRCSPGYGAPEQYGGDIDDRADIYGLGATFYTLLTGLVPTDALYRMKQIGATGVDPLVPMNGIAPAGSKSTVEASYPALAFHRMMRRGEKEPSALDSSNRMIPAIPPALAEVIHRAMSINRNDRFSRVEEFWEALRRVSNASLAERLTVEPAVMTPIQEGTVLDASLSIQQAMKPTGEVQRAPQLTLKPAVQHPFEPLAGVEKATALDADTTVQGIAEDQVEKRPVMNINPVRQRTPETAVVPATPFEPQPVAKQESTTIPPALQERPQGHHQVLGRKRRDAKGVFNLPGKQALILLVLIIMVLLSVGIATSHRFDTSGTHRSISVLPSAASQRAINSPTSKVISTFTPVSNAYPHLATLYVGTIHDIAADTTTKISLTSIQQQQGSISGYLDGTPENGPLEGTIATTQHIQFIVTSKVGQATSSYDGFIRSDGNIVGTYCRLGTVAGKCSGYGLWSVSPAS